MLRGGSDAFYEELSLNPAHVRMSRLNNGAPLLRDHDASTSHSIIGVVVNGSAKLTNSGGTATVRFAKAGDDPEADKIWRKVVDGILCKLSVGYRVYRYEAISTPGKEVTTRRATDWEPFEISVVSLAADDAAGFT